MKGAYRRPFVAERRRAARRRRPGEPAHRAPAAGGLLPGPRGPAPAAGGRGGRSARGARADPVRHRLRGGDGDAAGRARQPWARTRSRRWTSASGATHHQPLEALRPMADTVLAVVCERLRREGAWWPTPSRPGDRGAPAVRLAARRRLMALRCVYTDLDGTLARRGRLAVPRRRGRLHAAARPGAGGMPPRRRGGGAEVRPAQGSGDGGRPADRPDARTSTRSARAW